MDNSFVIDFRSLMYFIYYCFPSLIIQYYYNIKLLKWTVLMIIRASNINWAQTDS